MMIGEGDQPVPGPTLPDSSSADRKPLVGGNIADLTQKFGGDAVRH
jgi:hypothetical protein